ncbi:MAG TPA: hypothetical protein VGE02_17565 [Gemmatimonadales bacterium]
MLLVAAGACDYPAQSAAYVAPEPGTVYDYGDFTNTVTAVDGWRTTFVDDQGREARRIGLFITEDPRRPLSVDSVALDSLWPLELGRKVQMKARQGEEVYKWEFSVLDTVTVQVPAGRFTTLVVEGVQTPELVRSPEAASTVLHTWWFAPEANAVVRFQSTYLMGPATGRRFEGQLRAIRHQPAPGDSGAVGDSGAAAPAAAPRARS